MNCSSLDSELFWLASIKADHLHSLESWVSIIFLYCTVCSTGVIVQFSTNNGVQWQLLRELDFGSFLEPQVVTIELPPAAKTSHTVFRWWQPQQGEHVTQ